MGRVLSLSWWAASFSEQHAFPMGSSQSLSATRGPLLGASSRLPSVRLSHDSNICSMNFIDDIRRRVTFLANEWNSSS